MECNSVGGSRTDLFERVDFYGCLPFFINHSEHIFKGYFEVFPIRKQINCILVLISFIVIEEVLKDRFKPILSVASHQIAYK